VFGGGGMVARGIKWPRGQTPAVTPAGDHYRVSKNFLFSDPRIDYASWRLDVHGVVARPLSLSIDDLRAMPSTEEFATLACVGNSVPARAISTALWKGVQLSTVLQQAGASSGRGTGDLVFIAADNYTDSIPLALALHPGMLLAYEMNGQPLPREHGAPLRAIVPGIYGMKNVKWIESIELVAGDYRGYWQQRGWSDAAPYQTLARIDEPRRGDTLEAGRPHEICGIAFSGDRGISRMEVLVHEGPDSSPARPSETLVSTAALKPPLSPYTWILWNFSWQPHGPGRYTISAHAYDGVGRAQIVEPRPNFPDGATGLHTIEIDVQ
jgi:DMSO/TMAO reductase YedYZ molybdopterin-dependent catalytic subunit